VIKIIGNYIIDVDYIICLAQILSRNTNCKLGILFVPGITFNIANHCGYIKFLFSLGLIRPHHKQA
jgi:hypothetical protein